MMFLPVLLGVFDGRIDIVEKNAVRFHSYSKESDKAVKKRIQNRLVRRIALSEKTANVCF